MPSAGRADRALPGHRRSGSYQVTNAPVGGCRALPAALARGSAAGHAIHAVSDAQGRNRGRRQVATSLREGCCGSPEDNLVRFPRQESRSNQSWRKCYARLLSLARRPSVTRRSGSTVLPVQTVTSRRRCRIRLLTPACMKLPGEHSFLACSSRSGGTCVGTFGHGLHPFCIWNTSRFLAPWLARSDGPNAGRGVRRISVCVDGGSWWVGYRDGRGALGAMGGSSCPVMRQRGASSAGASTAGSSQALLSLQPQRLVRPSLPVPAPGRKDR